MAGGRAAAKVALKGIAKPLEQLLKECEEVVAKDIAQAGRKAATSSARAQGERGLARAARQEARRLASGAAETGGTRWSARARSLYGDPPSWMAHPHGHHVVFRNGSAAAAPYVEKSQEILRRFGIDPVLSKSNLIWAPNAAHSAANAREVLSRLTETVRAGGGRAEIEETLARAGREVFDGWP